MKQSHRAAIIQKLALKYNWRMKSYDKGRGKMHFIRGLAQIDIDLQTLEISTVLLHPKSGATQLFRSNVGLGLLKRILDRPRTHTGRGYYKNTL